MSHVAGTDQDILRTAPPVVEYYLAIMPRRTVLACSLNKGAATWGETALTYDAVTVGNWGDVVPGQTLLAYSSVGVYKGKVRLRSITAATITVAANYDIDWADDDLLYVVDVYEPWSRPTYMVDAGPGLGITYYKDTDILWPSNAGAFPPKANAGVAFAGFLGAGGIVDVPFGGAGWSFANASGATISAYAWDIADGAFQAGGAATETCTARFSSAAFRWIHYAVTDSNGITNVHRLPIWTFGGNYQPLTNFKITRRGSDGRDSEVQIEAFGDDLLPSDIAEGTGVVLFARTYINGTEVTTDMACPFPGRQAVLLTGWILKDSVQWDPETGVVRFSVGTIGKVADDLPGYPTFIKDVPTGYADGWHTGEGLSIRSVAMWLWHWHTNLDTLAYMSFQPTSLIAGRKFKKIPPLKQIEGDLLQRAFARLGVTRWGSINCRYDPQMLNAAARAARQTVIDLAEGDWTTEIAFDKTARPQLSDVIGGGIAYDGTDGTAYRARAPGRVGRQSGKSMPADHLIVSGQDDLNDLLGRLLAARSSEWKPLPIENYYDIWEPALQEYLTITVPAASNPRGYAFDTDDLWIIRRVDIEDVMGGTPTIRTTVELLVAEGTATGVSVPIPSPPSYPSPPPPPDLPPLEPPIEDGTGERVLVSGEGGFAYTLDCISGNPPTWAALNGGLTDSSYGSALATDPQEPWRAWGIDNDGTVYRHDNWTAGGNWTSVLTEAAALTAIEAGIGLTPDDVENVDVKAFEMQGGVTIVFAVCQVELAFDDHRVRILRSGDLGATWSVSGPIAGYDFGPFTEGWEYTRKLGDEGWGELAYDAVNDRLYMAARSPRYGGFGGKSALNWSDDGSISWNAAAIEGGQDVEDEVGPAAADTLESGQLWLVPWKQVPEKDRCIASAVTGFSTITCCRDNEGTEVYFGDSCAMPNTGDYLITATATIKVIPCKDPPGHACNYGLSLRVSAKIAPAGPFLFNNDPAPYSGFHTLSIGDVIRFTVGAVGTSQCCFVVSGLLQVEGPVANPQLTDGEWVVGSAYTPISTENISTVKLLAANDGYGRFRGMLELTEDDNWAALQVETPGSRTSQTVLEVNGALQQLFQHPYRTLYGLPTDGYTLYIGRSWVTDEEADATDPQLFGLSLTKGSSWADKSGNLYALGMRSITGIGADWSAD